MFPLEFTISPWTLFFVVLTLPPWIASFLFSFRYIQKRKSFYYSFFCLTFLANILIFFAGNFLTILIFFELLSLASVPLVIYEKTKESIKAGKIYFFFSLLSGILVFSGVMILSAIPNFTLAYILMGIGFLIKCGAYPFHVWLPQAHPVAPSPASAILSGCIIKVGFYGLFRVVLAWNPTEHFGQILLIISLVTMLYGVLQALFQTNAKRMLAYHSVSQMGYILLGLSMYVITKNFVPLTGSLMHAMNHAFFKSSLFLAIGILYLDSHTYDMYKMKGYLKRAPWISLLFLVAILGITGTPFFNGFVSKTFIHEELLIEKAMIFKVAESIFLFTAIGTFVSNFKMYYLINLRPVPQCKSCKRDFREIFPLFLLALTILGFGLFPLMEEHLLPMNLLPHVAEFLEEIIPFHKLFVENLTGYLWIALSGLSLIYIGLKWEWFHKKIPSFLDPLYWYEAFYKFMITNFVSILNHIELGIIFAYSFTARSFNQFMDINTSFENYLKSRYQKTWNSQVLFFVGQNAFEEKLNHAISFVVVPQNKSLSQRSSVELGKVEHKIHKIFQEMVQLSRFLFSISNQQEIKSSQYYENFMKNKGRKILAALGISIVVMTIGFLIFYWKLVL